jgi:1-acyl-sn-glycerol-3-phosphate acyltransferase
MPRELFAHLIRAACGVRSIRPDALPEPPLILFANHSSHLDFATIWSALPPDHRARVRPVAGRDYWQKNAVRRWLADRIFHAVLIERHKITAANNPLEPMVAALDAGHSLIVFPEGTRSIDGRLQPFKAGLYHLAQSRPAVPLVPLHLDNLNRIMPKGSKLPIPLIAVLRVGEPLRLAAGEPKPEFLVRAAHALAALQPHLT